MKTLLKNCDIISTGKSGFEVIHSGYLGIDDDIICYVGDVMPLEKYDYVKDMTGKILCPGLINTHCHSAMTLLRGVGSDLPLQEWLFDHMFPIEDKLRAQDVKAGSELAILEMLSTGTVSFSDMYYFCEDTIAAVEESGIKANISRPVQAFDPNEPYEKNYRAKESKEIYRQYHGYAGGRVRIDFSVHAEYTCNEEVVRRYNEDCKAAGASMHIHLSETKSEHDECIKKYGKTPTKWFADLGTFESPTFAAHCVWATDEDIAIMHKKGVMPVHNPSSNMKLGSGFAPIPKMLERGIAVGLGTDGAASNNNLNMLEELHLATVIHNGHHTDPIIMNPNHTLKMATANGALIQGRSDCGCIAVGKKADIIAISTDAPHMLPAFDPITTLCYSAQGSDVCMTMVDGRILYENGEFLTLDKDRIFHDVKNSLKYLYE